MESLFEEMNKVIIELKNLKKDYDEAGPIVRNINLQVYENEFLTLLGPSGCGKTTTLRMIAGFEQPPSAEVIIEGKVFNDMPPYARPINTVFQRYALFPHLNVIDNVKIGLKNKGYNKLIHFFGGEEALKKTIVDARLKKGVDQKKAEEVSYFALRKLKIGRASCRERV